MASLKRNTLFSAVTNLSDMLQFVLMILAGRMLGTEGFGVFSFAHSMATVFLTFSDFGLNQFAIREVSRRKEEAPKYIGNILTWRTVLALTAFILLLFTTGIIMEVERHIQLITAVLGVAVMIRFFSLTGRCFLHAYERFDVETVVVLIEQCVLLVIGTLFLWLGYGVLGLASAFFIARAVGCLLTFLNIHKVVPFRLEFDTPFIKKLQINALPIGVALVVMTGYIHIDSVLLAHFRTFSEVGLYNSAFKIYSGLFLIPSIICTVFLPRLSTSFVEDFTQFKKLVGVGTAILAGTACAVCGVGYFGADQIIGLVFGEEYREAAGSMRFFFIILAITFQIWFQRIILIAVNHQKVLMYMYLAAVVLRICIGVVFIPQYGIMGAVSATLVCEIFLFVGIWLFLWRRVFAVSVSKNYGS